MAGASASRCWSPFRAMHALLWIGLVRAAGGTLPPRRGADLQHRVADALRAHADPDGGHTADRCCHARGVPRSVAAASLAYEFPLAVGSAFALSVAFVIDLPELRDHDLRWIALAAPILLLGRCTRGPSARSSVVSLRG